MMWKHFTITFTLLASFATLASGKSDPGIIDVVIDQVKTEKPKQKLCIMNVQIIPICLGSATDCGAASAISKYEDLHKT